jgi:hypothetical protein
MKKYITLTCVFLTGGITVLATTITPSGTALGTLSAANFGGSGIPNTAVETTTVAAGQGQITLGLTATQRYSNPALGNDGFGTFFATAGQNNGLGVPPHSIGPTWNFDYYINADNVIGTYTYQLIYSDNTTGVSTTLALPAGQDSWNLSMGFLNTPLNTIGFNPNAAGVYGFELDVLDADKRVVGTTAINVDVASVPDGGSTMGLLGFGIVGLMVFNSRRTRLARAK